MFPLQTLHWGFFQLFPPPLLFYIFGRGGFYDSALSLLLWWSSMRLLGSQTAIFHQLQEDNLSHHAHTLPRDNLHPGSSLLPVSIADVLLSCRKNERKQ